MDTEIRYDELTPNEQRLLQRAFKAHPKIIAVEAVDKRTAENLQAIGYLADAFLGWAITAAGRELMSASVR